MHCACFIWRPPSLSELTPIILNIELTYLGKEASIYNFKILPYIFQKNFILLYISKYIIKLRNLIKTFLENTIVILNSDKLNLFFIINNFKISHFQLKIKLIQQKIMDFSAVFLMIIICKYICNWIIIWRLPILSDVTPNIFNMELTHLGSEASKIRLPSQSFIII